MIGPEGIDPQAPRSSEKELLMLEKLKLEFSRPVPDAYRQLAETAEIAPTAPSHGYSIPDIIADRALSEQLAFVPPDQATEFEVKDDGLTELGKFLKERLQGDTLIDLGSGEQVFVPNLAKAFGAKRYIGVDTEAADQAHPEENFDRYVLREDMLTFVASLPDNYGSFFLAGVEDYSGEMTQEVYGPEVGDADVVLHPSPYMKSLLTEIHRATRKGGLLILGANNTLPNPESAGFKSIEFHQIDSSDLSTDVLIKE